MPKDLLLQKTMECTGLINYSIIIVLITNFYYSIRFN